MLVVVTKRVTSKFTQELCQQHNIPYVTVKWPAGLLTNFDMIMKNVKKLITMREDQGKGEWNKFVKHEQTKLTKDLHRLERFYEGLTSLKKRPDAIFVIDLKKEKNAVKEARGHHIPLIGITDTNVNPDLVDYPIPANDDAVPSIEYFLTQIVGAYAKGNK